MLIGDWFFVFVIVSLSIMMGGLSIFSFLSTWTFGDQLGELENYDNQELADSMSTLHMFTGISMGMFVIFFITMCPAWMEYEQIPQSEYTYELNETETVFATDFDTLTTDHVRWANTADKPEKYCLYKTKTYNILGGWPSDPYISLTTAPCEDKGKYEL